MQRLSAAVLLVLSCGCTPKLNVDKSMDVDYNGQTVIIEAIKNAQTIKVTGNAMGSKVDVFVFLEKNQAAAEKDILAKKTSSNIIASAPNTETINLQAAIPANEAAVVQVKSATAKKAHVTLKIAN